MVRTISLALLSIIFSAASVQCQGPSAPWIKEWADTSYASSGYTAVDPADAVHILYFTNGDNGAARWIVRTGPNTYSNPLTGQAFPNNAAFDNLTGCIRPSIAFDNQRNAYIAGELSWAGQVAVRKFNYVGNNTWQPVGPAVNIPGMSGYWPVIKRSKTGALYIACQGGHDGNGNWFPHPFSVNPSGDHTAGWNTSTSWDRSNLYDIDNAGNIHTISASNGDYYYRRFTATLTQIGNAIRVTDTNGAYRIFSPGIAMDGNTALMAFQIADNYRGKLDCWLWRITNGTALTGPEAIAASAPGMTATNCSISTNNGYAAISYLYGPQNDNATMFTWDLTHNLRTSQGLDPGIRTTGGAIAVDPSGNQYVNARVNHAIDYNNNIWLAGCRIGIVPSPLTRGSISGVVKDNLDNPLAGALVELYTGGHGSYYKSLYTDSGGGYSIGGLPVGTLEVKASKLGYTTVTEPIVAITSQQNTIQNFTLPMMQGMIIGTVQTPEGSPVALAQITATGPGIYTGTTNSAGQFTLINVSIGDYQVKAYTFGRHIVTMPAAIVSNGEIVNLDFTLPLVKVGEVKQYASNTLAELKGLRISAVFSAESAMYVQSEDRSAGIRVTTTGTIISPNGLQAGDTVNVSGQVVDRILSSRVSERMIQGGTITETGSGSSLSPLMFSNRQLGGETIGMSLGVIDGIGLNNIGLLVSTTGHVTAKVGSSLWIDDGSGVQDSSGRIGVMVRYPSTLIPATVGEMVKVTGILTGSVPVGWMTNRRYIQMRDENELVKL